MNETQLNNWLLLALTPHIGPVSFLKLLHHFQTIEAAINASVEDIAQITSEKAAQQIKAKTAEPFVEETLKWKLQDNCHILTLLDDDYPLALAQIPDPPPVLFIRGKRSLLKKPKFSIVGSRHPTPQGIQNAQSFSRSLCEHGYTVVSGLAAGIDTAAHQGALKCNGNTIAILGTGIDRIYPASNKELAYQLGQTGLLMTEFLLGTKPMAGNFPRRNRIIAALGAGTLVVEATIDSGSLITARLAGQLNKEVMAIPGSIHNPQSKGCHKLIKEGAKLVESLEDIIVELPEIPPNLNITHDFLLSSSTTEKSTEENCYDALLNTMGFDPIHPDVLAQKLAIETPLLYQTLLGLELDGMVKSTTGGCFQRLF